MSNKPFPPRKIIKTVESALVKYNLSRLVQTDPALQYNQCWAMNGLTMLDCFGPMSLDEVEQPMLDYVGSTTLGDVTLTNKAILHDIKGLHYWSKKCWIMLNQHCRVDSGNVGPTILSDVGPKMLGDVGATMLNDETVALSLFYS